LPVAPFELYHLYSLDLFQGKDEMDLCKEDYRSDEGLVDLPESRRKLQQTKRDGLYGLIDLLASAHTLSRDGRLSTPSIEFHYKKLVKNFYLPFPKVAQYLLQYTDCTFQTSSLICQSPAAPTARGTFVPIIA
jgi:hypothetical protein